MSMKPTVSLVMKVYNGEKYLREAIESILNQTFTDFEFLIIDDGSTDHSEQIIKSYDDERIRFFQNETNMGLIKTQNKIIAQAKGKYIAVMDCDDISYPTRFEKQVHYLENHPNVMMCGTYRNDIIDGREVSFQQIREYETESIRFSLFFGNFFFTHSSIMFRSEEYRKAGLSYGPSAIAEDYGVIIEMAKRYPVAVIPERLVAYRIYAQSVSKVKQKEITEAAIQIKSDFLRTQPIRDDSKELLLDYFQTGVAKERPGRFLEVLDEVAELAGADIGKEGNAYAIACEIVLAYLIRVQQYDWTVWRDIRSSRYRSLLSLKTLTGWKIWLACLIHYHR